MIIIVIDPVKKYRDHLVFNLSETTELEVIGFDNVISAMSMIKILKDISLVICKDQFENTQGFDYLYESIQEAKLKLNLFCLGENISTNDPLIQMIPIGLKVKEICEKAKITSDLFIGNLNDVKKAEILAKKKYKIVPINIFKYFSKLPCDIYLRIKKGFSYEFIKRIKANEEYDKKVFEEYETKGLTHLFIFKDHHVEFTNYVNLMFENLLKDENLDDKSKEEIQKIVLAQLTSTGFNESNLNIAKDSIEKITQDINSKKLKLSLIAKIYNSQFGYRFKRSYMQSVISSLILKNMSWSQAKHLEYLTMAAHLHNLGLENQEEMDAASDIELQSLKLDKDEFERVDKHAQYAAKMALKSVEIPSQVVQIIKQHHGSNNGVGYVARLSSAIQKLSILFIVAEEISVAILNSVSKEIDFEITLNSINEKYLNNNNVLSCTESFKKNLKSR